MESSHVVGADEKLSENGDESGWTMYIVSTIHDEGEADEASVECDENGEESDDSMASDASSGPSHIAKSRDRAHLRPAEMQGVKKHNKKNKNKKKNGSLMIKEEKDAEEILQHKADSAASRI